MLSASNLPIYGALIQRLAHPRTSSAISVQLLTNRWLFVLGCWTARNELPVWACGKWLYFRQHFSDIVFWVSYLTPDKKGAVWGSKELRCVQDEKRISYVSLIQRLMMVHCSYRAASTITRYPWQTILHNCYIGLLWRGRFCSRVALSYILIL